MGPSFSTATGSNPGRDGAQPRCRIPGVRSLTIPSKVAVALPLEVLGAETSGRYRACRVWKLRGCQAGSAITEHVMAVFCRSAFDSVTAWVV
jgi:hypothetical protein